MRPGVRIAAGRRPGWAASHKEGDSSPLELDQTQSDEGWTIVVLGEVEMETVSRFSAALDGAAALSDTVRLDFAHCEFVDSVALSAILRAARILHEKGGGLHLENVRGQPQKVLGLTGLDRHPGLVIAQR